MHRERLNTARRIAFGCLLAAGVTAGVVAFAQESEDDVKVWLDRMNVAVEQLNYRGEFVYVIDGNPETLRIVHRYADGVVREKINSDDEAGREILRTEEGVRSTFPEKRLVVALSSIPVASSLNYNDDLANYYQMTTFPKGRVAERKTQVVSIRARDEYRYGYLLFLDRETALPLKVEVRDENGSVIESILFTRIEYLDSIPEYAVAPSTNAEGFTWKQPLEPDPEAPASEIWGATRLPSGFRLSVSRQSLMAGSRYPVQHLVYTDGLATVSVFIAHPKSDADMPEGFSRSGSTNAYSLMIGDRLVTAMGEVPQLTVQRIATSLDAR